MIPKGSSTLRYFHSKRGSERNIPIKKPLKMIPKGSSTLRYFHSKRGSERNIPIKKTPSKWSLRGALLCVTSTVNVVVNETFK